MKPRHFLLLALSLNCGIALASLSADWQGLAAQGTPQSSETPLSTSGQDVASEKGLIQVILESFGEFPGEIVKSVGNQIGLLIFASTSLFLFTIFSSLRAKIREWKEKYNSLLEPAPPLDGADYAVSVLMLGVGGVGKTRIISRLTQHPNANSNIKTDAVYYYTRTLETKSVVDPSHGHNRYLNKTTLYISDYRGQKISSMFKEILVQQSMPKSPLRYGSLNVLLLVVDLVSPGPSSVDEVAQVSTYDGSRVNANLEAWSDDVLNLVFAVFTRPSLKRVILFINKNDLMKNNSRPHQKRIREAYKPLIDRLTERAEGVEVIHFIGSAETSEGIADLQNALLSRYP